jgi:hypothetical protein
MSVGKLAPCLIAAVIGLSACGGSLHIKPAGGRGQIDDPRTGKNDHVACIRAQHLPVQEVGLTRLQIGAAPAGPRVVFEPTPGAAQAAQIAGRAQGAEVIGSALLYPEQAPDSELAKIEVCLAKGVTG